MVRALFRAFPETLDCGRYQLQTDDRAGDCILVAFFRCGDTQGADGVWHTAHLEDEHCAHGPVLAGLQLQLRRSRVERAGQKLAKEAILRHELDREIPSPEAGVLDERVCAFATPCGDTHLHILHRANGLDLNNRALRGGNPLSAPVIGLHRERYNSIQRGVHLFPLSGIAESGPSRFAILLYYII